MQLLPLREASKKFGIPLGTLHRATRAIPSNPAHLPHIRLGRGICVREEWVEEWIERIRSDAAIGGRVKSSYELQMEIKRLEQKVGGKK